MFHGPPRFVAPVGETISVETSSADSFNRPVRPYTVVPNRKLPSSVAPTLSHFRHAPKSSVVSRSHHGISKRRTWNSLGQRSTHRSVSHVVRQAKRLNGGKTSRRLRRGSSVSSTSSNDTLSSYSSSASSSSLYSGSDSSCRHRKGNDAPKLHNHNHPQKRRGARRDLGDSIFGRYDPTIPASQMYIPSKSPFVPPKNSYISPAVAPYVQPSSVYMTTSQPTIYAPSAAPTILSRDVSRSRLSGRVTQSFAPPSTVTQPLVSTHAPPPMAFGTYFHPSDSAASTAHHHINEKLPTESSFFNLERRSPIADMIAAPQPQPTILANEQHVVLPPITEEPIVPEEGTAELPSFDTDSLILSRAPSGIFLPDFRSRSRAKRKQGCCDAR
eukprot:Gregarina_sp_Poly_1__5770@NODE_3036_length_1437_cov_744_291241_g1921_i0_p1_GENE_NODE_3036_length_1437_cov_744_291241_g1921_i0NODE_3036_length_1437_cov_744_291241_g1921_i0_p1_ORF_typecomplete_len385_score23_46Period_C/PF12114_8/0_86SR25/PF10500_9/3_9_NODE_3036_length_1437_cov_744_291241_g1921_i0731227